MKGKNYFYSLEISISIIVTYTSRWRSSQYRIANLGGGLHQAMVKLICPRPTLRVHGTHLQLPIDQASEFTLNLGYPLYHKL